MTLVGSTTAETAVCLCCRQPHLRQDIIDIAQCRHYISSQGIPLMISKGCGEKCSALPFRALWVDSVSSVRCGNSHLFVAVVISLAQLAIGPKAPQPSLAIDVECSTHRQTCPQTHPSALRRSASSTFAISNVTAKSLLFLNSHVGGWVAMLKLEIGSRLLSHDRKVPTQLSTQQCDTILRANLCR